MKPGNQQHPLAIGLDAVVHSGTKYLNGHSDLNAGVVVASHEIVERTREYAANHGGMLSFGWKPSVVVDPAAKVREGREFICRGLRPERATLSVARSPEGRWEIGQLLAS